MQQTDHNVHVYSCKNSTMIVYGDARQTGLGHTSLPLSAQRCSDSMYVAYISTQVNVEWEYRACVVDSLGLGITCLISLYFVYKAS